MEIQLEMDRELTECSVRSRIKGRAGTGDIIVGVCYRPLDQEDQVGKALCRQVGAALRSEAMALMGDFSHPDICWQDNIVGHKQSRRFLDCSDDNFPLKVIEECMRRGAMLWVFEALLPLTHDYFF